MPRWSRLTVTASILGRLLARLRSVWDTLLSLGHALIVQLLHHAAGDVDELVPVSWVAIWSKLTFYLQLNLGHDAHDLADGDQASFHLESLIWLASRLSALVDDEVESRGGDNMAKVEFPVTN